LTSTILVTASKGVKTTIGVNNIRGFSKSNSEKIKKNKKTKTKKSFSQKKTHFLAQNRLFILLLSPQKSLKF